MGMYECHSDGAVTECPISSKMCCVHCGAKCRAPCDLDFDTCMESKEVEYGCSDTAD